MANDLRVALNNVRNASESELQTLQNELLMVQIQNAMQLRRGKRVEVTVDGDKCSLNAADFASLDAAVAKALEEIRNPDSDKTPTDNGSQW